MTNKDLFKGLSTYKIKQVGGNHYQELLRFNLQSLFLRKRIAFCREGNAIKYICRHQSKEWKEQDIREDNTLFRNDIERDTKK